ncbi:armadillo-type protein [Mycena capillaripes]|nr:armadillo-type protein [Mycena capillaripes]
MSVQRNPHITANSRFSSNDTLPSAVAIRILVWDYLAFRVGQSELEARVIVEGNILKYALEMLRSPNPDLLRSTCNMLSSVAQYEGLKTAIVELGLCNEILWLFGHSSLPVQSALGSGLEPCKRLCTLLRHKNTAVRKEAAIALSCISVGSEEGANSVVEALEAVMRRLVSLNSSVIRWTCKIVIEIMAYPGLIAAVLKINPCKQLVWLLRHSDSNVSQDANKVLRNIEVSSEEGAQLVATARTLDEIEKTNYDRPMCGNFCALGREYQH